MGTNTRPVLMLHGSLFVDAGFNLKGINTSACVQVPDAPPSKNNGAGKSKKDH